MKSKQNAKLEKQTVLERSFGEASLGSRARESILWTRVQVEDAFDRTSDVGAVDLAEQKLRSCLPKMAFQKNLGTLFFLEEAAVVGHVFVTKNPSVFFCKFPPGGDW